MVADIVIIGGGATGTGIARDAAMRDLDVTLFERGALASETSGHSHDLLHSGARYAVDDPTSAKHCAAENPILKSIAAPYVRETGGLFVSTPRDPDEAIDQKLDACSRCSIPTERLSSTALKAKEPALGKVEGGFAVEDGVIDGPGLVEATAKSAQNNGAIIQTNTPVVALEPTETSWRVETPTTSVEAHTVVNAAGPWAGAVAALAGARISLSLSAGVMVACEASVPDMVLNRCREPSSGDIIVPKNGVAVAGTTAQPIETPEAKALTDEAIELLKAQASALLPSLKGGSIERAWAAVRPLAADDPTTSSRETTRSFTVIDHGERDGLSGLFSIVGGKLTTHRLMAEQTTDAICAHLGIERNCKTASEPLPE